MGDLKTYCSDQVTATFLGRALDSGFAEGEFIAIKRTTQRWSSKAGTDGQVTRYKSNDRRCTITVKLMHTSLTNDYLQGVFNADTGAPNGSGVGVFQVRDNNSGVLLCHAERCWLAKEPDMGRGAEASEYEWTFECADAELNFSGNPST